MKKNRSGKKNTGDFNNTPFKPLKGFQPKLRISEKKQQAFPENDQGEEDDDAQLFLRAAAGARRIGHVPGQSAVSTERRTSQHLDPADEREDERLFLQALQKIGATGQIAPPEMTDDEPRHRSSASRMRQLKRGTIRIGAELDLHGHMRESALLKLERFIATAYEHGQKAVLVITGKGINSPEGPVLRGAVAAWLQKKGKGMVAEFAAAPRELGGSGAFVVFLKSA